MTYRNDPRWIIAKRAGVAHNGAAFNAGARVLYYPASRIMLTGDSADKAWRDFEAAASDEDY